MHISSHPVAANPGAAEPLCSSSRKSAKKIALIAGKREDFWKFLLSCVKFSLSFLQIWEPGSGHAGLGLRGRKNG
jgi:hypothetical protein